MHQYTQREKRILFLEVIVCLVPLYGVTKVYIFPWLESYINVAHCHNYGIISGTQAYQIHIWHKG